MAQGGFDWGDFVDGVTSGGAKKRKQDTGEPFYGFTDFLRDLDVDLKRWSDQVDKKGMSKQFCTDVLSLYIAQHCLQQLGNEARSSTSSFSRDTIRQIS